MLEELQREFPNCDVKEVSNGMFNVSMDPMFVFVVLAKVEGVYFILERIEDGYNFATAYSLGDVVDSVKSYFKI